MWNEKNKHVIITMNIRNKFYTIQYCYIVTLFIWQDSIRLLNTVDHNDSDWVVQATSLLFEKLHSSQFLLLLSCIHHFKSDIINNMDHMRISGNEPSLVILCQIKWRTDSRHSNGHQLCTSPSRYIFVLIRSGIITVFVLYLTITVSISVQFHISIHRWRSVNCNTDC